MVAQHCGGPTSTGLVLSPPPGEGLREDPSLSLHLRRGGLQEAPPHPAALAGPAQAGLAHPAEDPLAGVVVPLAVIDFEVRAVLAPAQPVPIPVVRLVWLPVPAGRGPQPAGTV